MNSSTWYITPCLRTYWWCHKEYHMMQYFIKKTILVSISWISHFLYDTNSPSDCCEETLANSFVWCGFSLEVCEVFIYVISLKVTPWNFNQVLVWTLNQLNTFLLGCQKYASKAPKMQTSMRTRYNKTLIMKNESWSSSKCKKQED